MRRTLSLNDVESNGHGLTEVVSWQTKLRQAMYDAVSETDVKAIVRQQVEAAKAGDKVAIKFVMDYVLASKQPVTLVQNNHYGVEEAARAEARRNGRRM